MIISIITGCNVDPACRIEDFNGNCCMDESYCGDQYDFSDSSSEIVNKICFKMGPYRKPIICPIDFNTSVLSNYENCSKIEVKKNV